MISWNFLFLGPQGQDVGSLFLAGLLGPFSQHEAGFPIRPIQEKAYLELTFPLLKACTLPLALLYLWGIEQLRLEAAGAKAASSREKT